MAVEGTLSALLRPIVGGTDSDPKVFPDSPPEGYLSEPYIMFFQVGSDPIEFREGGNGDKKNARMRIAVWARTRLEASRIGRLVEDRMTGAEGLASGLLPTVVSGMSATSDPDTKLRGTTQDFSIWFAD